MIWKPEELEKISCAFCGSRTEKHRFTRPDGMRVVECEQCGLAYLDPRPRQEFIQRFYGSDYFTGVSADSGRGGLRCGTNSASSQKSASNGPSRPVELIKEKLGGLGGKSILEIGCATGDLLAQLKKEGARVQGLEISDYAAEIARARGLDVVTGTIENFGKDGCAMFDMAMAFEVIEHVPNPVLFLEQLARHVRPGGHVLLSTPNYACAQRYEERWSGFTGSFEHIYFFSKDVLERMSRQAGFVLTYWESSMVSGDSSRTPGFLEQQAGRFARFAAMSREVGLSRAMRLALKRSLNYLPYGNGHTLLVVLEKDLLRQAATSDGDKKLALLCEDKRTARHELLS